MLTSLNVDILKVFFLLLENRLSITMGLTELPEEILIIIFRDLDFSSLESLYNTCKWIRHNICLQGVIKKVCLSRNVMATANTLKTNFFKDVAPYILELNMCGVPDLSKTAFLPATKKLKNLKVLDISYTNLNVADLLGINKSCPNLKDLTVNLLCNECSKVSKTIILQCQSVFEHLENVHFVGSALRLFHTKLAVYLVAKATLHSLKYTIAYESCVAHVDNFDYTGIVKAYNQLTVYLLDWNFKRTSVMYVTEMYSIPFFQMIDFDKYECLIIVNVDNDPRVHASQIFKNFFKVNFNVNVQNLIVQEINLCWNSAVMMWNKETTDFDSNFYYNLKKHIKQYIPYVLNSDAKEFSDPGKRNWLYHAPMSLTDLPYTNRRLKCGNVRKRQALPSSILNYDEMFKGRDRVELSLELRHLRNVTVALSVECNYLKKLTYLSLTELGRFNLDFFNILFKSCVNLITLNVETLPVAPATIPIARSLPESNTLRNIRILHKRVDMKLLFSTFSQCPNLENVYVIDESTHEFNNLADPSELIEKCNCLYNIFIKAQMTDTAKTKTMQMSNKAKARFKKHHINIMIQNMGQLNPHFYDPFVDVFRLNPIRPLYGENMKVLSS